MDPSKSILIVEDSPEDFAVTERALRADGLANPVVHCVDGDEALDYLFRRGRFAADLSPQPSVILLDLNLPGLGGRDVLRELKRDPELRAIPVVVLTTSSDREDIESCYGLGANSYVQKPVDLERFMMAIRRLKEYWFEISLLPRSA